MPSLSWLHASNDNLSSKSIFDSHRKVGVLGVIDRQILFSMASNICQYGAVQLSDLVTGVLTSNHG